MIDDDVGRPADSRLYTLSTYAMALAAIAIAAVIVRRELWPASQGSRPPEMIPNDTWRELTTTGLRIGPDQASVTIVELGDFECPACAAFWRVTQKVRSAFPNQVALVYHHWPLSYHRNALKLALTAECVANQGRFEEFHDSVYSRQSELVGLSPLELASIVGIADTASFGQCLSDSLTKASIDRGVEAARRLRALGTPTVIIDGKLYRQPVDSAMLGALLER